MASGIKYTTQEITEILKELGYKLLDNQYKNMKSKVNIVDDNGYKYYCALGNLMSGRIPKTVSRFNPYSIDNINKYIENNNYNIKLLSKDFISEKNKLEFQCSCGNIYYCLYPKFIYRTKILCNDCSLIEKGKVRKHDLEFIKDEFVKYGFEPLFNEYNHCEDKLICKDKSGYIGELAYNNLISGYKFQIFSINNPYTIKNIKTYIQNNNLSCKVVSEEWLSSVDLLDFQCECGKFFQSTWKDFSGQNKTRCTECANNKSIYALQFEKWTNENNIKYKREYRISDCKYKSVLPFDYSIMIKDKLFLCEIDGQHHYKPIMCWAGEDGYKEQIIKDNIKNQYCKDNNIPLLRIPYWEFDNENYINILNKKLLGNNL